MSFLDRLADMAKSAATTDLQLEQLRRDLDKVGESVDDLVKTVQEHESRLVRLEAQRDADRAQLEAMLAQFRAEVERAELRLNRQLPPAQS